MATPTPDPDEPLFSLRPGARADASDFERLWLKERSTTFWAWSLAASVVNIALGVALALSHDKRFGWFVVAMGVLGVLRASFGLAAGRRRRR